MRVKSWAVQTAMMAAVGILGTLATVCPAQTASAPARGLAERPSFVFVLIDDLRWDAMSCAGHPFVKTPSIDRLAAGGARFANAFVTISLCAPSRASFLTGTYAHRHGVRTNEQQEFDHAMPTFATELQRAGYETAFIGKWHMKNTAQPRPGFDYWLSFAGQGVYLDPKLNENGRDFQAKGYITDLLTQYAVDFLKRPREKPFCLCLWHKAVHGPFTPAERHKRLYAEVKLPEPASWSDTFEGKPNWQRALAGGGGWGRGPIATRPAPASVPPQPWTPRREGVHDYFRTLAAVDDSVGRVLEALRETGALDRTVVIFAGDNGFFHGEHRRTDKRYAYEESIRIPLLMCGPGVARPGSVIEPMALNIDMAPTLLDLAGVPVPAGMQGRSLKPLLAGERPAWRKSFLYEYWSEAWLRGVPTMLGVRTEQWKYVRYPTIQDIDELYDLTNDPHEMKNLSGETAFAERLSETRAELDRLVKETGYRQ